MGDSSAGDDDIDEDDDVDRCGVRCANAHNRT